MTYIDLSHQINPQTPVYPGDPAVVIEPAGVMAHDGYNDSILTLGTHIGTHIDAPAHMIADAATLDSYSVDRFTGMALCIDARNGFVLPADTSTVDAIFFCTGASNRFTEPSYWQEYPVMSNLEFQEILKHKISIIGVDTGSVDNSEDFPNHKSLLGNDILIIENLTNLSELMGKTFEFTALPLNVALDGAPCRVIAKI